MAGGDADRQYGENRTGALRRVASRLHRRQGHRRRDHRIEEARKALVEIGAAQRYEARGATGLDIDDTGLAQLGQVVAEARLRAEVVELAAGHARALVAGEHSDDR